MDYIHNGSKQGHVAGFCEQSIELSVSTEWGKFANNTNPLCEVHQLDCF
jgi:hypothetical protein